MPFDDPAIFGTLVLGNSPPFDEEVPAIPTGLSATPGNTTVLLGWSDNVEGDFSHYLIYRATVSGGPYTQIGVSTVSDFTATGLSNGTQYFFVVTAVDDFGYESEFSSEVSATPAAPPGGDVTPPAVPTGLSATPGDRQVSLDWSNVADSDLANYKVYRSLTSGGSFTHIATRTASDYLDTGLTNSTTYYYKVSAVDTSGNESALSAEVSARPVGTSPDTVAPAVPTGLTATASDRAVVLDWNNNTEPDLANYKVYRSLSSGGSYIHVATTTSSNRTDGGLTNGTTYFYKVTAVDTSGNESGFSSVASATPAGVVLPPGGGGDGQPTYADRVVTINPGDDIDTKLATVSAGQVVGLASGVHSITSAGAQFSPRNGEVLVGETDGSGNPLAIIRGNWDQTETGTGIESPFPFPNTEAYPSNVKLLRLQIERFASVFQQAVLNGGDDWLIFKCFVNNNKSVAVRLGHNATLFGSKVFHNGQLGIKNRSAANGCIIDSCEVYDNNYALWNSEFGEAGGMKFIGLDPTNCIVRKSHYHHNKGSGIWYDDAGAGGIIEDNLAEYNTKVGIHYEISTGVAVIRRNIARFNGGAAEIYISNSRGTATNPIVVEDNTAYNENAGLGSQASIWIKDDPARAPRAGYTVIRRNRIKRVPISGFNNVCIGEFGGGSTVPPGITINENRHFTDISNAWQWTDTKRTWSQWQALGFDTAGSVQLASSF